MWGQAGLDSYTVWGGRSIDPCLGMRWEDRQAEWTPTYALGQQEPGVGAKGGAMAVVKATLPLPCPRPSPASSPPPIVILVMDLPGSPLQDLWIYRSRPFPPLSGQRGHDRRQGTRPGDRCHGVCVC